MRYVNVTAETADSESGEAYPVDTSLLRGRGIAIVAFPGGDEDPWVEHVDFRGRQQDDAAVTMATALLEEAEKESQRREAASIEKARVPFAVSAYQAFAALDEAGLLDAVETYMADPDTPRIERLAFQKARDFERSSPLIAKIAGLLGLTDAQVDELFIRAAQIEA